MHRGQELFRAEVTACKGDVGILDLFGELDLTLMDDFEAALDALLSDRPR